MVFPGVRTRAKFFACITKDNILKPWIENHDGAFQFNRDYGKT